MMTDSKVAYDSWHSNLDVDVDASTPWHKLVRAHLRPVDTAGKRVMEIGCGRGGFASWLARQPDPPSEMIGADYSETAVHKAREFADRNRIPNLRFEVADIQKIPHDRDSFDTVISCETIEHVPDSRAAVYELARVLRSGGGRLYLTFPNYMGLLGVYRGYLRLRGRSFQEHGQPINQFTTLPTTLRWIRAAGLRVVDVDAQGHYLPFPGRPPISMPLLDHGRPLTKWFGLHSLIVAEKP